MTRGFDLRMVNDPDSDFTLRQLWILYDHLPLRNQVTRSVLGMNQAEFDEMWNTDNAQLADIFDAIQQNTYVLISANTDSKSPKPKQPKPYPRPTYGKKEAKKKDAPRLNPLEGMPIIRVQRPQKEG